MKKEEVAKEITEILKLVVVALACPFAVPLVAENETEQSN
jgi:hypothetical protein